jgi:hypothetical protein
MNIKCRVTDYYSRWGIYLPLGFEGLMRNLMGNTT